MSEQCIINNYYVHTLHHDNNYACVYWFADLELVQYHGSTKVKWCLLRQLTGSTRASQLF